jgi:hypothetical protein
MLVFRVLYVVLPNIPRGEAQRSADVSCRFFILINILVHAYEIPLESNFILVDFYLIHCLIHVRRLRNITLCHVLGIQKPGWILPGIKMIHGSYDIAFNWRFQRPNGVKSASIALQYNGFST